MTIGLNETGGGKATDKGQPCQSQQQGPGIGSRQNCLAMDGSEIDEKFTDKTIERRQTADGSRSYEKTEGGFRHPFFQATEFINFKGCALLLN